MSSSLRNVVASIAVVLGASSSLACTSLTRPNEIAIAAEPLPARAVADTQAAALKAPAPAAPTNTQAGG